MPSPYETILAALGNDPLLATLLLQDHATPAPVPAGIALGRATPPLPAPPHTARGVDCRL